MQPPLESDLFFSLGLGSQLHSPPWCIDKFPCQLEKPGTARRRLDSNILHRDR
jgi:hypothetical protein